MSTNYGKIDQLKLHYMLQRGMTTKHCANFFGVTPSAISQKKSELNVSIVKNVSMENAHRIVTKNLNTIEQLHKINESANVLLDDLDHKPELRLKIMAEIRGQLQLQLEMFKNLYDMKAVQEFQDEVLTAIGEASSDVRYAITSKLAEKNALRRSISID